MFLLHLVRVAAQVLQGFLEIGPDIVEGQDALDVAGHHVRGAGNLLGRVAEDLDGQEFGPETTDLLRGAGVGRLEPLGVHRRDLEPEQSVEGLLRSGLFQFLHVASQPLVLQAADHFVQVLLAVEAALKNTVLVLRERTLVDKRGRVPARAQSQEAGDQEGRQE